MLSAMAIEGLELPPMDLPDLRISWFVYVVRLPERVDRDRIQAAMAARGISTGRYFAPIHTQPAWSKLPCSDVRLPVTEFVARRTLALPFFNRIESAQQEEVCAVLRELIESQS
jgi:perosamine synthetase